MLFGIEASSARRSPAAPPGAYVANAVHFAGSVQSQGPTYLKCNSLSCTDSRYFSFSFWEKGLLDPANNYAQLWTPQYSLGPYLFSDYGDLHVFYNDNSNNCNAVWYGPLNYTGWNHYLCSADVYHPAGSRIVAMYINDTLVAADGLSGSPNELTNLLNTYSFVFGDDESGHGPVVDIADVWIAPAVQLHDGTNTIPAATRRQFIDVGGNPVDPAGWPASAIQFYGDAASFGTNRGTGGTFSTTGTLTDAGTHP